MNETQKSLAQIGYEGYGEHTGWKTHNGFQMPDWQGVAKVHGAWNAGALAILRATVPEHLLPPEGLDRHANQELIKANRAKHRAFWDPIIRNPDGSLNEDLVHAELADYGHLLNEVPKVYCEITGGHLSYPNYFAEAVIGVYKTQLGKDVDEAVLEVLSELYEQLEEGDPTRELLVQTAQPYGDLVAEVERQAKISQHVPPAP